MNRNLILFSALLFFLIGLYAITYWIPIINVSKAEDVYLSNKEKKIKELKFIIKLLKKIIFFQK